MIEKKILIIGSGSHASVLCDILKQQGNIVFAVFSPEPVNDNPVFSEVSHFIDDEDILSYDAKDVLLVNGIGAMPNKSLRKFIFERFKKLGYNFLTVVADTARISPYCSISEGVQVLNNAVINTNAVINENTIINTSVTVEHDCIIGTHCHLAPGVTMSGQVIVQDNVHIATGANIINNITVGENVIISVGANVTKSIANNVTVYGTRAVIKTQEKYDN